MTSLFCQVCRKTFRHIESFRNHLESEPHKEEKAKLFQEEVYRGPVKVKFIDILQRHDGKDPLLGLSLVTLCLDIKNKFLFYLCHACEDRVSNIRTHLNSPTHRCNYYNYTNPNMLRFSWIRSEDGVDREASNTREQHYEMLQVADLPPDLFKILDGSSYDKAMDTLGYYDDVLQQTAARLEKMTIQTYLEMPNRRHPLLGLEHLVDCCDRRTHRRLYLCTVCNRLFCDTKIIKHLLSFNHICCYINAWHPSTLESHSSCTLESHSSSTHYDDSQMQDFAEQMKNRHRTSITDMKQVVLEPARFSTVKGSSGEAALKMLEDWRKMRKESSLITVITPGPKLALKKLEDWRKMPKESSLITVIAPGPKLGRTSYKGDSSNKQRNGSVSQRNPEFFEPPATQGPSRSPTSSQSLTAQATRRHSRSQTSSQSQSPPATQRTSQSQTPLVVRQPLPSQAPQHQSASSTATRANHPVTFCTLHCQVCNITFEKTSQFVLHVKEDQHKKTVFGTEADEVEHEPVQFYNNILDEIQDIKSEERAEPVIGLLHVVMCISTRARVIAYCACHVCEKTFPASMFRGHLHQMDHIKQTLMRQSPARLSSWNGKGKSRYEALQSLAWEEENARGPEHMVLKLIDLPRRIVNMIIDNDYRKVCNVLDNYLPGTREVPKIATHDELQGSHECQLGPQYMVHYKSGSGPSKSLCLLCETLLKELDFNAHVYSFEHRTAFLENKIPDMSLNLAKQDAEIHSTGRIKNVTLSGLHGPLNTYKNVVMEMEAQGHLIPAGKKLVPTETRKEIDKDVGSDKMTKMSERDDDKGRPVNDHTPQCPDVNDNTPQRPDVNDHRPQTIPVEKEAVPEKDSHVHKPDEKKCVPLRNVERRAGTSISVDRDTDTTERQKTEKGKETRKAHEGEEAGTERGVTSKDTTSKVGRDLNEEMKSRKRRRSGHASPEEGVKRQRLSNVESQSNSRATNKVVSKYNGPTVGLNFVVAVTHKKRCTLFCRLCRTRPHDKDHMFRNTHRVNYVKSKCPKLTAPLSDTQLLKIATELAEKDTGNRMETLTMDCEEEYEDLTRRTTEIPKALDRIQALLTQQRGSQDSPSATIPQPESLKHQDMTSLHEPSHHPDDDNETSLSPLATGSQSSPMPTSPTDTQPESQQDRNVQLESSQDPKTRKREAPQDPRTQSQDVRTQSSSPHGPRTQSGSPHDSVKQQGAPQGSRERQQAPQESGARLQTPHDCGIRPMAQKAPQHPGIQPPGNGTNRSPLASGSQSSPMHTSPNDTQPNSPQSCDVQLESPQDPSTWQRAAQDTRKPTQPRDSQGHMTQPVTPEDSVNQQGAPEGSTERQQAPPDPGTRQQAPPDPGTRQHTPQDCGTRPVAPQYSPDHQETLPRIISFWNQEQFHQVDGNQFVMHPVSSCPPDQQPPVTIKQEVKQEDHTHPYFSGHTVKHALDYVSSNGDAETAKRRRIGTCDGPSGPCSNVSSTATQTQYPSPQNQEVRVKVEHTQSPAPQNQEVRVKEEHTQSPAPQHQEVRVKEEHTQSPAPQHQVLGIFIHGRVYRSDTVVFSTQQGAGQEAMFGYTTIPTPEAWLKVTRLE